MSLRQITEISFSFILKRIGKREEDSHGLACLDVLPDHLRLKRGKGDFGLVKEESLKHLCERKGSSDLWQRGKVIECIPPFCFSTLRDTPDSHGRR